MPLPVPVPGLVIRYSYLWHSEHMAGREEGQKDRPCAIVAALRPADAGETRVLVLPVTHTPPAEPAHAAEIPAAVKTRLRLDTERSWVVLSEWNEFIWPGPDVRRAPGGDDSSVAYGMLPPGFFSAFLLLPRRSGHVASAEPNSAARGIDRAGLALPLRQAVAHRAFFCATCQPDDLA